MTTIRATGSSERQLRAELATLQLHVSVSRRDRDASVREAMTLHNALVSRGRELAESGDATAVEAQAPSTYANAEQGPTPSDEPRVSYVTTSRVSITLANLDAVGPLVLELALAGVAVHVEWSLTDASRRAGERACRLDAVRRAREIADDYAEALGTSISTVLALDDAEPGMGGGPMYSMRAAAFDAGGATPDVTVPTIAVSASIRGTYETR